jgi:hypothetical protein
VYYPNGGQQTGQKDTGGRMTRISPGTLIMAILLSGILIPGAAPLMNSWHFAPCYRDFVPWIQHIPAPGLSPRGLSVI